MSDSVLLTIMTLVAGVFIAAVLWMVSLITGPINETQRIEFHDRYKDCKVLEVNHFNGYFASNTNKLDCNGTIYNVDAGEYNDAMSGE